MKIRAYILTCLTGIIFVSCHVAKFGLSVPPTNERPYRIIKHVKVESTGGRLLQLVPVKKTKVHPLLKKEVEDVQGDNVVNVVITDKEDVIDVLVPSLIANAVYYLIYGLTKDPGLSSGISNLATVYQTRTYSVEADIIKYEPGEN